MARNRYDMDEVLEESFNAGQMKRLLAYIVPYKKRMLGFIFLMLSSSALTMLVPIFLQRIMDFCIPEKDMNRIYMYCGFTLLIAA